MEQVVNGMLSLSGCKGDSLPSSLLFILDKQQFLQLIFRWADEDKLTSKGLSKRSKANVLSTKSFRYKPNSKAFKKGKKSNRGIQKLASYKNPQKLSFENHNERMPFGKPALQPFHKSFRSSKELNLDSNQEETTTIESKNTMKSRSKNTRNISNPKNDKLKLDSDLNISKGPKKTMKQLRSIIDNNLNMRSPISGIRNGEKSYESRNQTLRDKNNTVEPHMIKFHNSQVLDNLVSAKRFPGKKISQNSLDRIKEQLPLAKNTKENISERQLPVIKPLKIPSSQVLTKNFQERSKKSNLSFGFENTFRRRKRELGNNSKSGKSKKKEFNKSAMIKGQSVESLPNSSYLNTFAKDSSKKGESTRAISIKDTMDINTNHRFGMSSLPKQVSLKNAKSDAISGKEKFKFNPRIKSPYDRFKSTRNTEKLNKYFTLDGNSQTKEISDIQDAESIHSMPRKYCRSKPPSQGGDMIEKYEVRTKCGLAAPSSNTKKVNQDSFIVKQKLCDENGTWMLAVLDGHGTEGHLVSDYVKHQLVDEFELQMKVTNKRKLSVPKHRRRKSKNGKLGSKNSQIISSAPKLNWNVPKPKMNNNIMNSIELFNKITPLDSEDGDSCLDSEFNSSNKASRDSKRREDIRIKEALRLAFNNTHGKMKQQQFDSKLSGTTCVTIVIQDDRVYIANAGDSRVVVGRKNSRLLWEPYQLSRDHKPDLEDEHHRIISNRGRVFPFRDEEGNYLGPHRVWHPNFLYPGLAMSRSLGDCIAHQYGVTSDPEITQYKMQAHDKFIILASDGIWEFMSNQEVIDTLSIAIDEDDYGKAIEDLVTQAHEQWIANDICIDDITCVVVKLKN
ncbi:unnamed protein product [Moneuplotes crassus]|uniref:PPM-type phosphatase domain-containing protein n=1 Tax=Euplotes crassus TaxID=5936 RepID=A0AAD1XYR7_EUPCR|nr:unnamed protein product [Moneuplotes crassus]